MPTYSRLFAAVINIAILTLLSTNSPLLADGPKDNLFEDVRPVPPPGIEVSAEDRAKLEADLANLDSLITQLQKQTDNRTLHLLPDVEIFARAVHQGLDYQEFFVESHINGAKQLLREGIQRAEALLNDNTPWTSQTGLVVRGFRSKIDQTVQPYGLVIPESYQSTGKERFRLDLWFHGRGERSSESVFISERMRHKGNIVPVDTIVLHPYGRYCNAFKLAGEVDVLEALAHAQQNYRVDENRIAVRGFSMGGAGCWQMAVHFPDLFFAANPGAGFSETPEFLKFFQKETLNPTWYEKKLWQMYDCPGYATNLYQLPTIAYSGELDVQKQAADIMETSLADIGLRLTHVIGPDTKHAIHADSLDVIETKLAQLAQQGRRQLPHEIRFATYTLKYNRLHWLTVTELGEHWEQATVNGRLIPDENTIDLKLNNVNGLRLSIPAGLSPFAPDQPVNVILTRHRPNQNSSDAQASQVVTSLRPATDQSWECELHYDGRSWQTGPANQNGLRKQHDLQGPIDDAFLDSFIVVQPTGTAHHETVGNWSNAELDHFVGEWRRQFRGDAIVKPDVNITDEDIQSSHLILFGDPASNSVLASIVDKLPINWTADEIKIGETSFSAAQHAVAMIYPNPANLKRYVVLNSGFTYREFAYLNNARQVPKLPDWAIIDLTTPPDSLWPGKVVDANFFNEQWQLK